jgi:hypothetical protein
MKIKELTFKGNLTAVVQIVNFVLNWKITYLIKWGNKWLYQ